MNMNKNCDDTIKRYKIKIIISGVTLTYSDCILLPEEDNVFVKFSDKFDVVYRYNKSVVISMEELK